MSANPAVSVVVPVFNAERYLDACLASVVAQDFTDCEILLYDDGSTDGSSVKLAEWAKRDPRIRVERGSERLGPVGSSNRIVVLARAPLIARLDADDLMLPGRLSAQVAAFAARPDAVLVGGLAWTIDGAGRRVRAPDLARVLRASNFAPFPHSAAMFRRDAWTRIGGYRAGTEKWEDVDFFLRMSAAGSVWVIPHAIAAYRQNADTTRLQEGIDALERAMDRMARTLEPGISASSPRIAPTVFRHIGATLLWSGGRPRLLGRVLRRAKLGFDRQSFGLLGWTAVAQVAPGPLRALLRARLAADNRRARRRLGEPDLVQWRPGAAATG